MGLFSFTQELAMDLGTANTIITCNDKMVVDEPSVIALDARSEKVLAVGRQAREIRTKRPIRGFGADPSAPRRCHCRLLRCRADDAWIDQNGQRTQTLVRSFAPYGDRYPVG